MRLEHRLDQALDVTDRAAEPAFGRLVLGDPRTECRLRVRLDEQHPERRPGRLAVRVEEPDGEVREHAAVCDQVLGAGERVDEPHRLEEERDAHAHPHGERDVEVVRLDPEGPGVVRQDEQAVRRQIGGDHVDPVAVTLLPGEVRVDEVRERPLALRREQLGDPGVEHLPFEDPLILEDAERRPDDRHAILPAAVLEAPEVESDDRVVQLRGAVAGREEHRDDRPGRRPGEVLGDEPLLLEDGQGTDEPDPLDPASLEDDVDRVLARAHARGTAGTGARRPQQRMRSGIGLPFAAGSQRR